MRRGSVSDKMISVSKDHFDTYLIERNKKDFVCMKEAKRMRISKDKVLFFAICTDYPR